jgi:hypothetical protein
MEEQRAEQATLQTLPRSNGDAVARLRFAQIAIETCDVRRMARARTLIVLESVQTPKIPPFV